jgi:hypothetical protein
MKNIGGTHNYQCFSCIINSDLMCVCVCVCMKIQGNNEEADDEIRNSL